MRTSDKDNRFKVIAAERKKNAALKDGDTIGLYWGWGKWFSCECRKDSISSIFQLFGLKNGNIGLNIGCMEQTCPGIRKCNSFYISFLFFVSFHKGSYDSPTLTKTCDWEVFTIHNYGNSATIDDGEEVNYIENGVTTLMSLGKVVTR